MHKVYIFLIFTLIMFCSCQSKPIKVAVNVPVPAEANISNYKTVAVVPLRGDVSRDTASKISEGITSSQIIKLVDDMNAQALIQKNLSMDDDAYTADISNIGEMIRADSFIFVESRVDFSDQEVRERKLEPDFSDDPYKNQILTTNLKVMQLNNEYQNKVTQLNTMAITGQVNQTNAQIAKIQLDQNYKSVFNGLQQELNDLKAKQAAYKEKKIADKQIEYTRVGSLSVNVSVSFTDAKAGTSLVSKKYTENFTLTSKAVNREPTPIDPTPKYSQIANNVAGKFLRAIIPHNRTVELYVDPVEHPDFDRGVAFLRNESFKEAADTFQVIHDSLIQSPDLQNDPEELAKVYYNYGLTLSLSLEPQSIDKAISLSKKAYLMNPSSRYKKLSDFCNLRKKQLQKLKEQIKE